MPDGSRRELFGSCGIRGVYGEEITEDVIVRLAQALAHYLGPGCRVCVGRDTRRSGPKIESILVSSLRSYGVNVAKLGIISTPGLYFLTRDLGFDAGVMITASHNPPEYNGLKLCNTEGMSVAQRPIEERFFDPPKMTGTRQGTHEELPGAGMFVERLGRLCPKPLRILRIVVDCACGPTSLFVPELLRAQGHDVVECNCTPNVEQCDRVVEPMAETLDKTVDLLRTQRADIGICFDGDGDRVVFLDRDGFLGFQRANATIAMVALARAGGGEVVGSVETGRYVEEAVTRAGGRLFRTIVGDIHIAREVQKRGAVIGIEECGHYILPEIGYFSSTVYPVAMLLASRDVNMVRQELSFIPPIFARECRIDCSEDRKHDITMRVRPRMLSLGGRATTIDGIRVDWDDGWLLIRPSGTSPYMKVNAEAFAEERLDELINMGMGLVQEAL